MEDQEGAKINVKSTIDVIVVYLNSKETSSRSGKKYKNHRQAKYHHTLKRRKKFVKCRARDLSFMKRVRYQLSYFSE